MSVHMFTSNGLIFRTAQVATVLFQLYSGKLKIGIFTLEANNCFAEDVDRAETYSVGFNEIFWGVLM